MAAPAALLTKKTKLVLAPGMVPPLTNVAASMESALENTGPCGPAAPDGPGRPRAVNTDTTLCTGGSRRTGWTCWAGTSARTLNAGNAASSCRACRPRIACRPGRTGRASNARNSRGACGSRCSGRTYRPGWTCWAGGAGQTCCAWRAGGLSDPRRPSTQARPRRQLPRSPDGWSRCSS